MEQDARFYNNEKKLLKRLKYPPNIGTKVGGSSCWELGLVQQYVHVHAVLFAGCVSGGHEQGEPGHHQAMDYTACDRPARY